MDKKLVRELKSLADPNMDPYDTISGKTMCADDFYEGLCVGYLLPLTYFGFFFL